MLSPGKALARRPCHQAGGWFPRACRNGQTNLSAGAGEGQSSPAHRYVGAVWCLQGGPRTCAFALSCPSPLSSPASVCTSSLSHCRSLQKDLGGSRCFPAPLHPASALGRAGTVRVEGRVLGTAFALGASKCPLPFCGKLSCRLLVHSQVPSQVLPHLQHDVAGSQELTRTSPDYFISPVPIKARSKSTSSATPGSPGSSATRRLLSRDGNRRGGEGRRRRTGSCESLSFLPCLERRGIDGLHRLGGGAAGSPAHSARPLLFCRGAAGVVAGKSVGVSGERQGYLGSRSGIAVGKRVFC